ncbi:MAG: class I SAM-dependent methyltransferase [Acidimicrobiales bacterium]
MGSEEAQGRLWGVEPDGWASHELNHAPLFLAMIDAAGIGPGAKVLDIGCGAGHSSRLINRCGASVVGVDAAQGMVDHATRTFDGIDFQVGAMEDLAFGDNEFDIVFAANSVQYAADLGVALRELERVCKPGGALVAGLFGPPDGVSYRPVLEALGQFMPKPPPGAKAGGPFRLSAPGVLEESFVSAGIEVLRTGEVNCPFQYGSWDDFWRGTRAAGPTQMAIGLAGPEPVEEATREAVGPFTAEDGSITIDPNVFIFVVGQA